MEGGCTCRQVRYRADRSAAHCPRLPLPLVPTPETGTRSTRSTLSMRQIGSSTPTGEPEIIATPSASGRGQNIARCPVCKVAVWSNYPQAGPAVRFVRVGTSDQPDRWPPDIHIYTSSKQIWVTLPTDAKAVPDSTTSPPSGRPQRSGAAPHHARPRVREVLMRDDQVAGRGKRGIFFRTAQKRQRRLQRLVILRVGWERMIANPFFRLRSP